MGRFCRLDSWLHNISKDVTTEKSVTQMLVPSVPEMVRVPLLAWHEMMNISY